jgi:hypothetical protein
MLLPPSLFRRLLGKFSGLPVVLPILVDLGLTLLRMARQCKDETPDRPGKRR